MYKALSFPNVTDLPLNEIKLPPGFHIALYAREEVPSARSLALSGGSNQNATIVYVGSDDPAPNGTVRLSHWGLAGLLGSCLEGRQTACSMAAQ